MEASLGIGGDQVIPVEADHRDNVPRLAICQHAMITPTLGSAVAGGDPVAVLRTPQAVLRSVSVQHPSYSVSTAGVSKQTLPQSVVVKGSLQLTTTQCQHAHMC